MGLKIIAFILPEIGPGQVNSIILLKTYKDLFEICTSSYTYKVVNFKINFYILI